MNVIKGIDLLNLRFRGISIDNVRYYYSTVLIYYELLISDIYNTSRTEWRRVREESSSLICSLHLLVWLMAHWYCSFHEYFYALKYHRKWQFVVPVITWNILYFYASVLSSTFSSWLSEYLSGWKYLYQQNIRVSCCKLRDKSSKITSVQKLDFDANKYEEQYLFIEQIQMWKMAIKCRRLWKF